MSVWKRKTLVICHRCNEKINRDGIIGILSNVKVTGKLCATETLMGRLKEGSCKILNIGNFLAKLDHGLKP